MEAYGKEEVKKEQNAGSWDQIRFGYDANNHLFRVEDGYGARVRYEYDCLGNLTLEGQSIDENVKRRIRYFYNKNGWRVRKEEGIQGNGDVHLAVTHYEHDENGNVIRIITPGVFEIRKSYDGNDRLIAERTLDKNPGQEE